MRRWGTVPIAALGVSLLIALGGCGGSDGGTGTTSAASGGGSRGKAAGSETAKEPSSIPGDSKSEEARDRGEGSASSGEKVETEPLEVSGGGSAQYRVPGGDNSVQEFGEESDEAELEEAATALHGYLVARAEENWPSACANLAETVEEQLQALAKRSKDLQGKGCAVILQALTPPLPAGVRRASTSVDAGSLRLEDEQAFLIYKGAEDKTYTVLMVPEDDGWKVGALAATPLS